MPKSRKCKGFSYFPLLEAFPQTQSPERSARTLAGLQNGLFTVLNPSSFLMEKYYHRTLEEK
jgi:hypothetical protein